MSQRSNHCIRRLGDLMNTTEMSQDMSNTIPSTSTASSIIHLIVNVTSKNTNIKAATASTAMKMIGFLSEQLKLNQQEVKDLMDIGGVYYLPNTSPSDRDQNSDNTGSERNNTSSSSIEDQSNVTSLKATASKQSLRTPQPRRITKDRHIYNQDYIRVHPRPRRYMNANKIDWAKRIVSETPDYFVIDKPNGVPSHATMDNRKENVLECLRNAIRNRAPPTINPSEKAVTLPDTYSGDSEEESEGEEDSENMGVEHNKKSKKIPLFLPQRLDVETSGLMLIARNSVMIRLMNDWLKRDLIRKRYKALLTFTVHAKNDDEVEDIQKSIFSMSLASTSSTLTAYKLAGYYKEGDIITSYLKKSSVAPKFYYWSSQPSKEEIENHPLVFSKIDMHGHESSDSTPLQQCQSKVIQISRPIIKSKREWINHAIRVGDIHTDDVNTQLDRQKVQEALFEWIQGKGSRDLKDQDQVLNLDQLNEDIEGVNGDWNNYVGFQEVVLELMTGRTHQVRGQLQSLQWHPEVSKFSDKTSQFHIAGDYLYPGASSAALLNKLSVHCSGLERTRHDMPDAQLEKTTQYQVASKDNQPKCTMISRSCPHLSLQACSVAVNFKVKKVEQHLQFQISHPWWQSIFS